MCGWDAALICQQHCVFTWSCLTVMFLQNLSVFIHRDRSLLCSSVCKQEVRHSSSGPDSVRTQPYALPQHIFVKFSFPSFLCSPVSYSLAMFIFLWYVLSLHLHNPSQLMHALTHPWMVLWQKGNRACSPLTVLHLIQPSLQIFCEAPKGSPKLCYRCLQRN